VANLLCFVWAWNARKSNFLQGKSRNGGEISRKVMEDKVKRALALYRSFGGC